MGKPNGSKNNPNLTSICFRKGLVMTIENTRNSPIPLESISIEAIQAAQARIADAAIHTPLIRLNVADAPAEIFLKLETLQPIGSFKVRGALNAIRLHRPEKLANGVWTASTGNMAQGVAWAARQLGLKCTVVMPDTVSRAKITAIRHLGAEIIRIPPSEWFQIVVIDHTYKGLTGQFIHPILAPGVMAGHGTIGLEILADLPDVDAIITPYGGGGLTCGVAAAVRALKPDTRLYACELETGTPLAHALAAGKPVQIEAREAPDYTHGFSGAPIVLPEVWPLVNKLVNGSLQMTVAELTASIKLLAEQNHIIVEGAGAAPVATALAGRAGAGKVVCVVSGGHIDSDFSFR